MVSNIKYICGMYSVMVCIIFYIIESFCLFLLLLLLLLLYFSFIAWIGTFSTQSVDSTSNPRTAG